MAENVTAENALPKTSVIVGEIHTGLLHHSVAVSPATAAALLDVVLSERVSRSDRPNSLVSSARALAGVDCLLPTATGAKTRGIGTVASRASILGGHIVAGSAWATVARGQSDRRLPWSYYLARPGVLESVTRFTPTDVVQGFLRNPARPGGLDLDAIARRTVDAVQDRTGYDGQGLDHRAAVRSTRTSLRWAVSVDTASDDASSVRLTIQNDTQRTLHLTVGDSRESGRGPGRESRAESEHESRRESGARSTGEPGVAWPGTGVAAFLELCEDVARHDWLLTAVLAVIARSRIGSAGRSDVIDRLRPAMDHLLHLWMPAARTDAALRSVWRMLEEQPGLSRQWQVNVDRIRDQVALGTLERLGTGAEIVRAHGS